MGGERGGVDKDSMVVRIRRDKVSEMKAKKLVKKTSPRKSGGAHPLPCCPFCEELSSSGLSRDDEGLSSRLAKKQLETVSSYGKEMLGMEEGPEGTLKETCSACVATVRKVWDLHLEIVEIKEEIKKYVDKLFQKCKQKAKVTQRTPANQSHINKRSPRPIEIILLKTEEDSYDDDGQLEDIAFTPDNLDQEGEVESEYPYHPSGEGERSTYNSPQAPSSPTKRPQRQSRTKAEALLRKVVATDEDEEDMDTASNDDADIINFQNSEDDVEEALTVRKRRRLTPSDITRVSSTSDSWQCSKCSLVFENKGAARKHFWYSHGGRAFQRRKKHPCPHCDKLYRTVPVLQEHIQAMHAEGFKGHPCSNCGRVLKYFTNLKAHEKFCLAKAGKSSQNNVPVAANAAKKVAETKYNPEEFGLLSQGQFWKCSECSLLVRTLRDGVIHVRRVHRKEKGFTCDQCGYSCFTFPELRKHNQKHHGEEGALPCRKCGHLSHSARDRIIHEVIACRVKHPEVTLDKMRIKIITCENEGCGYRSAYEKDMNKHKTVHSDTQNFKCEECGKAFKHQQSLRDHERRNHGKNAETESNYRCPFCEASFKTKGDRDVHEARVHPENVTRDFICDFDNCGSGFLTAPHLKRHQQTVHGQMMDKLV